MGIGRELVGRYHQIERCRLGLEQAVNCALYFGDCECLDAGGFAKVAIPLTRKTGQRLDYGDYLPANRLEPRPESAAENPDERQAHTRC